jgi:hypothetical protein
MKTKRFPANRSGLGTLGCAAVLAAFIISFLGSLPAARATAARGEAGQLRIMSWGQPDPEWQRTLHISGLRQGCSSAPESCVRSISSVKPGTEVFLSILLKPETVTYGEQYSALSLRTPSLVEIGLDDFVSQYSKLGGTDNATAVLNSFIDGIKSQNRNLKFGATIYENDLGTEYLSDRDLPPAVRAKFDTIHFYIHYRGDTPKYAEYIPQLKALFPRAQIIGSVYAYDRISYLPCAPKGQPCTPEQEMGYFNQSLDITGNLLRDGTITWLEIFPGLFGHEGSWPNWKSDSRLCSGRIPECVANTQKMDAALAAKIKQLLG